MCGFLLKKTENTLMGVLFYVMEGEEYVNEGRIR